MGKPIEGNNTNYMFISLIRTVPHYQRDFKPIYMTDKDRAVLDEKTKNFIRNSKIILGTSPPTKETNYMEVMKDPKDHFASITMIKYNSNMINIIYIPSLNSLFLRTLITPGDLTAIIEIRIENTSRIET